MICDWGRCACDLMAVNVEDGIKVIFEEKDDGVMSTGQVFEGLGTGGSTVSPHGLSCELNHLMSVFYRGSKVDLDYPVYPQLNISQPCSHAPRLSPSCRYQTLPAFLLPLVPAILRSIRPIGLNIATKIIIQFQRLCDIMVKYHAYPTTLSAHWDLSRTIFDASVEIEG